MDYAKIRPATEHLTAPAEVALACDGDEKPKQRRFSMLAYTGAPVSRPYGKAVFSIGGIEHKAKVPILLNHDESQIVGYADLVDMTDEGLRLSGVISAATDEGLRIAQLADEGFPWEASVGLSVEEWTEVPAGEALSVNGLEIEGPASVGTRSRLLEVSFVTAGADKHTAAFVMNATAKEGGPTVADSRAELSAFLAEFPGREGWAAKLFADGKTVTEARLELAAETADKLTEALARVAELEAKLAAAESEREAVASLRTESRTPGVGFVAAVREDAATEARLSPDQAWERDATLRAEFVNNKKAFDAYVSRHGWEH